MKRILPYLISALTSLTLAHADNITSQWIATGDGVWEEDSNWTSVPWPNNGLHRYSVEIGDSLSHRTITTSGNIVLSSLQLFQTSSTGGLTLKLGGDMELTGSPGAFPKISFNNTTGDASRLVIDLNGHHLNISSFVSNSSVGTDGHYTIKSSGNGGIVSLRQIYAPTNVTYEGDITVRAIQSAAQSLAGITFSETTTLQMAAAGAYNLTFSNPIGNLIIGDAANSSATNIKLVGNGRIRGDFSIQSHQGIADGPASTMTFRSNGKLYVSGGFRDETTDSSTYISEDAANKGTIVFNGNPELEQEVFIGRKGLDTHLQVGESASSLGNILLKNDLTTTGNFTITSLSRLNLGSYSVKGGNVRIDQGAIIGILLGEQPGAIRAAGNLTLNELSLEIAYEGSAWVNGSKLVLFQYDGELTGVPGVNIIDAPEGFSFDALINDTDNKEIYLTNVVIPEPTSTALLLLIGAATALKVTSIRKSL